MKRQDRFADHLSSIPRVELGPGRAKRVPAGTPLYHLGLSTRAHNILRRAGILSIEDALTLKAADILRCHNAGEATVLEVFEALANWRSARDD